MRNDKKIVALTTSILLLFVFGSFLLPVAKADTGLYEQRTDPADPFLFTVDTLYLAESISYTNAQYFYHQVFLETNKQYLFYNPCGYMSSENTRLWIHSAISDSIDYYYEYVSEDKIGYILYMSSTETGLYNITIRFGEDGWQGSCGFSGIGVLEIPTIPLDTEMTYNYWDFQADPIIAGIIELDSTKEYQTGYDGEHHDYSNLDIYYVNINSLSNTGYEKLDGSHEIMDYRAFDIITTNNLGQGAGEYLFYGGRFSLMETGEIIVFPIIPIIIIVVIISIGIVITVGVIIVLNKRKSKI